MNNDNENGDKTIEVLVSDRLIIIILAIVFVACMAIGIGLSVKTVLQNSTGGVYANSSRLG